MTKKPPFRKLKGYAFDPTLSLRMDTALINEITYTIPWEDDTPVCNDDGTPKTFLRAGPCGEYIDVIDYDPTVNKFYIPVNLNDPYILAQDGLDPSGSNPQFHQQMVYAVAMTTIKNFEAGLGRPVLWSPRRIRYTEAEAEVNEHDPVETHKDEKKNTAFRIKEEYVPTLRIYPHAFRDANAFYSPQKKALLFGYFAARPADITLQMPDNLTFTCLSHDIIAHETTHAILDGLRRKYIENTNPDVLAFHEAFADIVALFQHFTFKNVLKNQIAATRGNLSNQNLLGKLAQEFGIAIGNYGALRDAIGTIDTETKEWKPKVPTGDEYRTIMEPHERGSILVAAIFDAFLTIYKSRVADLLRIASGGTGELAKGELHPDLVNRLAIEASKASHHVLTMCIRALDYCPPVDITFGDYLRAIITADIDLVEDDRMDYRVAFIDAFRKRGIYPSGIKYLSIESLCYPQPDDTNLEDPFKTLVQFLKEFRSEIMYTTSRQKLHEITRIFIAGGKLEKNNNEGKNANDNKRAIIGLHQRLSDTYDNVPEFEKLTGLKISIGWQNLGIRTSVAYDDKWPAFTVHSLHLASRNGPGGNQSNQIILSLTQTAKLKVEKDSKGNQIISADDSDQGFLFSGGSTLIFDLDSLKLKYAISKPLIDIESIDPNKNPNANQINTSRFNSIYQYQRGPNHEQNRFDAYFGLGRENAFNEPFLFLHTQ